MKLALATVAGWIEGKIVSPGIVFIRYRTFSKVLSFCAGKKMKTEHDSKPPRLENGSSLDEVKKDKREQRDALRVQDGSSSRDEYRRRKWRIYV